MVEKMKELEAVLAADESLAAKYKETIEKAEAAGAKSDSEAISMAAKAVGVEITAAEVESAVAAAQVLSDDDLDLVNGGEDEVREDAYGHDKWCWGAWHCYTAALHTEDGNHEAACWSDYYCAAASVSEG